MHFSQTFVAAVAALLSAGAVDAHMKIRTPTPFNPRALDNGPLDANGGDFPCKFSGRYTPGPRVVPPENVFAIGAKQTLSFIGSAVHGGGSCQLSLTQDLIPNKNSVWKVIHSIEGGCPSAVDGNLPSDANGSGASVFDFQIPPSIAPGEYTFAWSWLNRIGNREFYMNCAPITVTRGVKRRYTPTPRSESPSVALTKRQDLPNMFVANTGACRTREGWDIRYPNPGPSLRRAGLPSRLHPLDVPICILADGTKIMPGNGNPGNPGNPGPGPSPSPPPSPSPTPDASPVPTPPVPSPPVFVTKPSNPTPTPTPNQPTPPGGNNGSAQSGPCPNEGKWNCIGGTQFQRCASGQWTVPMPVAPGTTCSVVQGGLEVAALGVKRSHGAGLHRRRGHF
ncbi:hypothetical protein BDFG_04625 [Blastomyces dermatitidis ATCC 26199]|nr:hypothetical protein BDFG_04625 [Blastomyces dermatitidis ATCC 26199]